MADRNYVCDLRKLLVLGLGAVVAACDDPTLRNPDGSIVHPPMAVSEVLAKRGELSDGHVTLYGFLRMDSGEDGPEYSLVIGSEYLSSKISKEEIEWIGIDLDFSTSVHAGLPSDCAGKFVVASAFARFAQGKISLELDDGAPITLADEDGLTSCRTF